MTEAFPGSRWWRFDFHTHTPASSDYDVAEAATLTPRDWLLAYMRASVDAVAVTDHNCSDWIEPLQQALTTLNAERPAGWRPLVLFPGVEISAGDGLHLLALFAPGTSNAQLGGLLHGKLNGWRADKPSAERQCTQSTADVIDAVHALGGLAIPAHADKVNGLLFGRVDALGQFQPQVASRCIDDVLQRADALELQDAASAAQAHFAGKLSGRAIVAGSDAPHRTANAGRRAMWVKMTQPNFDGLRLALLDPESALQRALPDTPPPQTMPGLWIRSLTVENLHLRRSGVGPLQVQFNPAYNAVIGGRGSGKSTLIECLRLALARDGELQRLGGDLWRSFENFRKPYRSRDQPGLVLPETSLTAEVVKGVGEHAETLRYVWRRTAGNEFASSVQRMEQGQWRDTGLSAAQAMAAFAVRIFSQKQVLGLADKPQALLDYIDEAIRDDKQVWQQEFDARRAALLEARRKHRALRAEIAHKPALELEHKQASRKALVFANSNFGPLLKDFQRSTQQERAMGDFHRLLAQDVEVLREALDQVVHLQDTELTGFDAQTKDEIVARNATLALRNSLLAQRAVIAQAVVQMTQALAQAETSRKGSAWQATARAHIEAYQREMERLKAEGIHSAQEAATAVAAVDRLGKQLNRLKAFEEQLPAAEASVQQAMESLTRQREALTVLRNGFIAELFARNDSLKVQLRSMAHGAGAVVALRGKLRLPDTAQWADVWADPEDDTQQPTGFLWDATDSKLPSSVGERLQEMKRDLESADRDVLATQVHGKLINRLKELPPEAFDELATWFPDDEVRLEYRPAADQAYKSIAQASAGQQAAAMLSFLLAHGDEPMLLDQPEDDLDNALVSQLVVTQLRKNKQRRQLIIVTHNANIVVNGDAELVLTMGFAGGQIQLLSSGGMQETQVREDICRVMEGGKEAFRQRYKRILEDLDDLKTGKGAAS
jgi:ABC-type lipoprotein export system ATPase subunit